MSEPELMTILSVAQALDVSARSVRNYVANGALVAVKLGGLTRIRRSEFERFMRDLQPVIPGLLVECQTATTTRHDAKPMEDEPRASSTMPATSAPKYRPGGASAA